MDAMAGALIPPATPPPTLCFLPVAQWSVLDLDGAQLLDAALQTYRHLVVGDVEGLPLPAGAAGSEAVGGGGGDGGGTRHLLYQSDIPETGLVGFLIHKLVILEEGLRRSEDVCNVK